MEENKNNKPEQTRTNNDEIDLIELFSIIGNKFNQGVNSLWRVLISIILYFYNLIYNWKIAFAIAILIGGVLGFLSKNTSQYYSSTATVNSRFLKGVDFLTEVKELNGLCTDEGRSQLAKALNLPVEIVEDITEINAIGYFEKYKFNLILDEHKADSLLVDSYDSEKRFEIIVSSELQNISKEQIQKGFEYYFSKNKFIEKNMSVYERNLKIKSETLKKEKAELDDFSSAYKNIIDTQTQLMKEKRDGTQSSSNIVLLSGEQQKDSYIKQSGELAFQAMQKGKAAEDEIAEIRVKLSLLQPVEFVNRFSEFATVSLSAKGKTALGMLIGFIAVLVFVILVDVNSFLKSQNLKRYD